jgi:hypothetical protein
LNDLKVREFNFFSPRSATRRAVARSRGRAGGKDIFKQTEIAHCRGADRKGLATVLQEFAGGWWRIRRSQDSSSERRRISYRHEQAIGAMIEDLDRPVRAIGADDRRAAGERLGEH